MVSCLVPLIFFAKEGISEVVIFLSGKNNVTTSCSCRVSLSYRCCNKWPQMWWLKTTQTYHLTVLEVRFPCLFQLAGEAPALLGWWCPSVFKQQGQLRPSRAASQTSASIITFPFLTLTLLLPLSVVRTLVVTVGPPRWSRIIFHFKNLKSHLITSAKSFLPRKGKVTFPGSRTTMWMTLGDLILLTTSQIIVRFYSNSVYPNSPVLLLPWLPPPAP